MMKKVLISIKGSHDAEIDDSEAFELMTDGEYINEDGTVTFSYAESELTGCDGVTTFNVEPERVTLRRGGAVSDMIFCENQKHHFLYETPFGAVTMGIDTQSIRNNMRDDGGSLEVRYNIEVDNVAVSHNFFKIDIKQSEGRA